MGVAALALLTVAAPAPAADQPPTIAKAFGAPSMPLGGTTSLTFTISDSSNGNTGVGFTDGLPTGLVVASSNGLSVFGCGSGATVIADPGSSSVSLSGGTIGRLTACRISLYVTAVQMGIWQNSVKVFSDQGNGNIASAQVTVVSPVTITKTFGASSIPVGGSTSLRFVLNNYDPNAQHALTFIDSLPAGLVVSTPSGLANDCGGTVSADAGSSIVRLDSTLASGSFCTLSVNVTGAAAGSKDNSVTVNSDVGESDPSSASLEVVAPPAIGKAFQSDSIPVGGSTPLTFALANPNPTALNGVGFSDPLPSGLVVATPNGLSGSCGSGTISAAPGAHQISLSGGTIDGGASCTFSVDVKGVSAGEQRNTTGNVVSKEGGTGGVASASITVGRSRTAGARPDLTYVTNGTVYAVARTPDRIYLGGSFTYVGPRTGPWVAISATTGNVDPAIPQVSGGAARVDAVVADGSGGFYIGGDFTHVGGAERHDAAHIRTDKTVDPNWNPRVGGEVLSLAKSDSAVYMGGSFGATAVDAATGAAKSWNPGVECCQVNAITVSKDGKTVYLGGTFIGVNGDTGPVNRYCVAAVDATTGLATSFKADVGPGTQGCVNALALSPDGSTLYIGGHFGTVNGTPRYYLAAVDAGSGAVTTWFPVIRGYTSYDSYAIQALAASTRTVYVAGSPGAIAFDASTGNRTAWNPAVGGSGGVSTLALSPDASTVYLGGGFTSVNVPQGQPSSGTPRGGLAAVDATEGKVTSWDPHAAGGVDALAASGNIVAAGGTFASFGGQLRNGAAALNAADGTLTAWNPDLRLFSNEAGTVYAIAVAPHAVYLAGSFLFVNGTLGHTAAVAVDPTTGNAMPWDPSPDAEPYALALSPDGSTVYLGGTFTHINTDRAGPMLVRNHLAAVDARLGTANGWDPNANGIVRALTVSGSDVYAGGGFTQVNASVPRSYAAKLDATTGTDTGWNPAPNGGVRALAVAGSNVYLGGDFTSVNGSQTRNHAAAVDATIGNVTGWNPNVECSSCGPGPTVASLAVSGKTVFLGGDFAGIDSINGTQTRTNLAQVDATTGIATDFNPTPDGQVNALGADGGGGVVAGGSFNAFDQDVQEGIAVFNVAPSNVARPTIAGKRTVGSSLLCGQGAWAGTKPQTYAYQWVLDVRAIPGAKGARYKLTNASAGHRISCQVVATNLGGSASAQSAPVSIPAIRAPVISRLKIKPTRIVAAATGSSIATTRKARSATGATVSYTDTQAATTRFAVFRLASGVKQGKRCVKPQARKPSKPKPACTRYLLLGNFTHTDVAGRNSFHFTGRVGGHKLVVGSYRLTATPRARGRSGRAVNVLFDVISSPKRPAKESLAATVVLIASAMLG